MNIQCLRGSVVSTFSTVLFAFFLIHSSASEATSFIQQPFPDTVEDAPVIVRGKTGKPTSNWGIATDGGKRIYTFNDLEVQEVLKGTLLEKSIVIRELGGEKDGMGMHVAGASHFDAGEDVVVFLSEQNAENSYDVRGLMMGKYTIKQSPSGKEYLEGPGISSTPDSEIKKTSDTDSTPEWTLDALRELIREQAKNAASDSESENESGTSTDPNSQKVSQSRKKSNHSASELQNSSLQEPDDSSENSGSRRFLLRLTLVLAVGGLAAGMILRRRR